MDAFYFLLFSAILIYALEHESINKTVKKLSNRKQSKEKIPLKEVKTTPKEDLKDQLLEELDNVKEFTYFLDLYEDGDHAEIISGTCYKASEEDVIDFLVEKYSGKTINIWNIIKKDINYEEL